MERNWSAVRAWLGELLVGRGVDRISAEELTVPPGLDELFSLLQVKRHYEARRVRRRSIVDCAPTGETLRLLSFPDVARWWLERVFPQQGRIMDAARPFARAVLDLSLPDDAVLDDVGALIRNLIAMNEILRDHEHVSVRLVMNPDRMVVDEARRTFTYLNLYGFLTDAVVVNRMFGEEVGEYFGAWRERQLEQLQATRSTPSRRCRCSRRRGSRRRSSGRAMLDRLGDALFADHDPAAVLHDGVSQRLEVGSDGRDLARRPAAGRARRDQAAQDRARAGRAGQRREAHDAAAAGAGRLSSGGRGVRGRRARSALPCTEWRDEQTDDPLDALRERIRVDRRGCRPAGRRGRAPGKAWPASGLPAAAHRRGRPARRRRSSRSSTCCATCCRPSCAARSPT